MTPSIMSWLGGRVREEFVARRPSRVLEVGSLNINGSARDVLRHLCGEWTGIDRQAGHGVDRTVELVDLLGTPHFDAIVCTEALEHDPRFWMTLMYMRLLSRPNALWVVTTPANGFPYHGHPHDYYRFTEDAYRDVIFESLQILDLRTVEGSEGSAVCGMAVKDPR